MDSSSVSVPAEANVCPEHCLCIVQPAFSDEAALLISQSGSGPAAGLSYGVCCDQVVPSALDTAWKNGCWAVC